MAALGSSTSTNNPPTNPYRNAIPVLTTQRAPLVYDGQGDIRYFFYRYERTYGKGLNDQTRAEELSGHLAGPILTFFCNRFIDNKTYTPTEDG